MGTSKKWTYGITAVPDRLSTYLPRVLSSLAAAGFDKPRLFIDGLPIDDWVSNPLHTQYEATLRFPRIKLAGNWVLSIYELYYREPCADFYAIFQDDCILVKGVKEYLSQISYPSKGYLNLYTFPENEKPAIDGFYLSNQRGLGAVALVFSNEALRTLLSHRHLVNRPLDEKWGQRKIDGGIVDTMRQQGWQEYCHNPSLAQHIGLQSTIGNKYASDATTFPGEEFDARTLLGQTVATPIQPVAFKNHDRIGLAGWNCNTGLGELNRQIATYADVTKFLIKPHPKVPSNLPPDTVDSTFCPSGAKIKQFLERVDIVLFCEQPVYPGQLVEAAKKAGKRVVCVAMHEWMPAALRGWPQQVDLIICPTKYCYEQFAHVRPSVYFPWPVDCQRFQFQQRTKIERFLFLNGHGGWQGRKGGSVIRKALELWPEFPLVVRDQTSDKWPSNASLLPAVACNSELYKDGDVLICPHSVDGLGLEVMEAMACGMPVISTKGRPWNEVPAIAQILAKSEKKTVQRPVDWYSPDPLYLVETCKARLGKNIENESREARTWAEARDWDKWADKFNEIVRTGRGGDRV